MKHVFYIMESGPDKRECPHDISLISLQKQVVGRGASNEYHNICLRGEIRKISILLGCKKCLI